jgi:hypothetical protein
MSQFVEQKLMLWCYPVGYLLIWQLCFMWQCGK